MDILALLQCLHSSVSATPLRQLRRSVFAMLVMHGRVTRLGMARWGGKGCSYRTVPRFFSPALPWGMLLWGFFRQHVHPADAVYLLAGDEVVVTKAGKHTYGLDRFFASRYGKPVPGWAFCALSLVSVQERRAFPIRVEQGGRSETEKATSKATAEAKQPPPSPRQSVALGVPRAARTKTRPSSP